MSSVLPRSHRVDSLRIDPTDPRFDHLVHRGFNRRFVPRPDYVRMVASTEQVIDAVQTAVRDGHRLAVRSGGHCLEGFVGDPDIRVLIDTSSMTGVSYDPAMDAFEVEAGTLLGEVYRRLFLGFGVLLPAGQSPAVGAGGHVPGGGFGFLHRKHGLAVDHLHAVEVVVVDEAGTARAIVATRDPSDPHHDLFWAHTGGGAGNFGVVTRFWFRTPGAQRGALLPRAPDSLHVFRASLRWSDLDEASFVRVVRNFDTWCEQNSAPGDAACDLFSLLFLLPQASGVIQVKGLATGPRAEQLVEEYFAALGDGLAVRPTPEVERLPWLGFALRPFPELFVPGVDAALMKGTDALLRRGLSDAQIATAHAHLQPGRALPTGFIGLATYGGNVNAVARGATATPHRGAIIEMACAAGWGDPADEARSLAWVRSAYRDIFASTGGVPVPGEQYDGALINHPDVDLRSPEWNRSGVPWHAFYYQDSYPRLQAIKTRYDPRNVFRHALSIEPG